MRKLVVNRLSKRIRNSLVELASKGYTNTEIIKELGIGQTTLYRWFSKNPELVQLVDAAMDNFEKELVLVGLRDLAKKEKEEELEREWFDDGVRHKVKERTRRPDSKALAMLAAKHFKGEYVDNKEETKNINIRISQKDRALTAEQRKEILYKDRAEGQDIELDANDYKELESDEVGK